MPDSSFVETINEVGLRHVVADGIASIDGSRAVEKSRRQFVFENLAKLFEDASIGALAGTDPKQYVRRAKPSSYDSYRQLRQLTTGSALPPLEQLRGLLERAAVSKPLTADEQKKLFDVLSIMAQRLAAVRPMLYDSQRASLRRWA
jgi:hypothetical protein